MKLTLIILFFSLLCKAQDSINTPKIVLDYLYKRNVDAKYLEKVTLNKSLQIKEYSKIIVLKDSLISFNQKEIEAYSKHTEVVESEYKKEKRQNKFWKLSTMILSVPALFGIKELIK